MLNVRKLMFILCVGFMVTSYISAATWDGGAETTSWDDAENWDTNSVPESSDEVTVGDDAVVYRSDSINRGANTYFIDNAAFTLGSNPSSPSDKRFRNANGGACTITIADNAVFTHSGKYFWVGNSAVGTINQIGGVLNVNVYGNFFVTENASTDGSAYNLLGGQANITVTTNASTTDWYNQFLGKGGADGTFYVNGGELNYTSVNPDKERSLYIMNESIFQIDKGTANFSGIKLFAVGHDDSGTALEGEASLIVNGGTLNITNLDSGATAIGGEGQMGYAEINGGNVNIMDGSGLVVGQGYRGRVIQSGGNVNVDSYVTLGYSSEAEGSYYRMEAGTLNASGIILYSEDVDAEFVLAGGEIVLAGDWTGLAEATWFNAPEATVYEYDAVEDLTYIYYLPFAHNPNPYDTQEDIGETLGNSMVSVSLSWDAGLSMNAATAGQVNTDIVSHLVYLGESEPNMVLVGTVSAGDPVSEIASLDSISLEMDKTYVWRVDEVTGSSQTITGPAWSFSTPNAIPIMTEVRGEGKFDVGSSAQLTASYESGATSVYEVTWYCNGQELNPGNDSNISISYSNTESILDIISMSEAYEGAYYCVATNNGGNSEPSSEINIAIKKLLAEYKFEQSIEDSVSGYTGTMINGSLEYGSGIVTTDGQYYAADPNGANYIELTTDSYPKAGFGNGLDEFTYTCWINFSEKMDTSILFGVLNGLPDEDNNSRSAIEFGVSDTSKIKCFIRDENNVSLNMYSGALSLVDNVWHLIVATSDGETLTFYADGEKVATGDVSSVVNFGEWEHPMTVLADNKRGEIDWNFSGGVDDLRIYNYALSDLDIAKLYYNETQVSVCVDAPNSNFNVVNTGSSYCRIDMADFAVLAADWLDCGLYPECY